MNVKQGDLAIIVKSGAGNEGMIVEVLSALGNRPEFDGWTWAGDTDFCWMVKSSRPMASALGPSYYVCPCPDRFLRPVSGLPDTEYTDESEPIKELA